MKLLLLVSVAMLIFPLAPGMQAQSDSTTYDPITMDPASYDSLYPPSGGGFSFLSHGQQLNALWFQAAGEGPHPTVILLHGYPGNEKNLDLAQALRRGGINVKFFHYRGAWGSGGEFSFGNALEDVQTAIDTLRASDNPAVDKSRIALVGHSMGGGLALLAAANDPGIECVVTLDHWNFGREAKEMPDRPERAERFDAGLEILFAEGAPLTADINDIRADFFENADAYDVINRVDALANKNLLIISTPISDRFHVLLTQSLESAGAGRVQAEVWQTDHSFQDKRIALSRAVYTWLTDACGY